ncbi:hypothetical protein EON66_05255 [archaeon]|nr:MAG: hypothetical protein EON66_05255 [archaeon]
MCVRCLAVEGAPFATLAPVLTPLLDFSLKKLQASKSAKLARAFCHSFSLMVGFHGAESVQPVLAAMSPSLFNQVIDHIIIPEAPRVRIVASPPTRMRNASSPSPRTLM